MQLLLTGEEVTREVIGRSHGAMLRLFDFGLRASLGGSCERVGLRGQLAGERPRNLFPCQPPACIASPCSCSRARSRSTSASPRRCSRTRASMPYEVRVCGAAPGLGDRRRRPLVPRGRRARGARVGRHRLHPRLPAPRPRRPAGGRRRRAARRARARARGSPPSRPAPSRSPRPACSTARAPRRTGTTRGRSRRGIRSCRSTRTCCSSTRARVLTSAGAASGHRPVPAPRARATTASALSNHVGPAARRGAVPQRRPGAVRAAQRARAARRACSPPPASGRCTGSTSRSRSTTWPGNANVSPRTFSRRFVEDTGYTPMQWVLRARVDLARELLERTDLGVEQIADRRRPRHRREPAPALPAHPRHVAERVPAHLRPRRVARADAWRDPCAPWRVRRDCALAVDRGEPGGDRRRRDTP